MSHVFTALGIMALVGLVTGNWLAAACLAVGIFIGREHNQAEMRIIKSDYGNHRANAPWYCGFLPRAWTRKGLLDWAVPSGACLALYVVVSLF